MESTVSVSKGCFVFKRSDTEKYNRKKSKGKRQLTANQQKPELWFTTYTDIWTDVKTKLDDLNKSIYSKFISDTVEFMITENLTTIHSIPTACLLTGVNLPDHESLFDLLATELEKSQPPVFVAILYSEHFTNIKNVVISMVSQLLSTSEDDSDIDELDDSINSKKSVVKRSECSISALIDWYSEQPTGTRIAILIKDFEMCQQSVLQNFILLLSSYTKEIPFVLAIGIATSISNLHNSLPHHIVTKLKVKMFVSEASVVFLNHIMDQVFFKSDCSFYLGGRILEYMTEVFLYYNFSIRQFVEGLKYCLIEHLYRKPLNCLCVSHESAQGVLFDMLDKKTLEEITKLRSTNFKLKNDENLKETFLQLIRELKQCIEDFHIGLRMLHVLVADLPQSPLGTQLRELYCIAMKKHIIEDKSFKTCLQLLKFLSKEDLLKKFNEIINVLKKMKNNKQAQIALRLVHTYVVRIEKSQLNIVVEEKKSQETKPKENLEAVSSRSQFKRKLIENLKHEDTRSMTEFEKARLQSLDHLSDVVLKEFLVPPSTMPLHELLIFDDLPSIRHKIVGEDRAAQYTAFVNPQHYIDCDCCGLEFPEQVLNTMPDLCIVYKLHLESRFDQINMYDWLQKFISVVYIDQDEKNDDNNVDPALQARFVRVVNELQHLGYIRPSKYKADHVQRLTCGS